MYKRASLYRFFIGYWINGAKFLLWPLFYCTQRLRSCRARWGFPLFPGSQLETKKAEVSARKGQYVPLFKIAYEIKLTA
jgi:hypothetical protein